MANPHRATPRTLTTTKPPAGVFDGTLARRHSGQLAASSGVSTQCVECVAVPGGGSDGGVDDVGARQRPDTGEIQRVRAAGSSSAGTGGASGGLASGDAIEALLDADDRTRYHTLEQQHLNRWLRDVMGWRPMLTVAKITRSAADSYAEYLDGKARPPELGDYYLKDGERTEAPGRWVAGAERFGLDGQRPVSGEQLRALMDVRRPDNGEALRRVGATGEAVAALDATFSAPKSVSAVWAIADQELRERIERAHETAIDRALSYAIAAGADAPPRVSQDTVVHEKATGVVATSWRHTTARAVADQAPDPQLHSHVLLHAAVRRDGELVAIDSRSWLVHQREVGAAYRTELARELTELGFAVRAGSGGAGGTSSSTVCPQGLLDRWSSRRHQVQAAIRDRLSDQRDALAAIVAEGGAAATEAEEQLELLERNGQLSPKQERLMATATRSAKTPVTVAGSRYRVAADRARARSQPRADRGAPPPRPPHRSSRRRTERGAGGA